MKVINRVGPPISHPASLVVAIGTFMPLGCAAPPRVSMRAERYRIEVRMDPATHQIVGRTAMDLVRTEGEETVPPGRPVSVELFLHPNLRVTGLVTAGVESRYHGVVGMEPVEGEDKFAAQKHRVVLRNAVDALTLVVDYEGELYQDVSAGEKPGEIHNFTMRAHISPEGVFLSEGYWYPVPVADEDAAPVAGDYVVLADPVPGIELVAGAETDAAMCEQTGRLAWRSPYALDGMVLVGGPHEVHRATHNGVDISVHLRPEQAEHAAGLIDTVRRNLDRYQPLIGPYPASEYKVVDNFFSSGFAYPTFTLLSSAVINMGPRAQMRHGMFDHEMLHSWWGNGIMVDSRDGNWCEAVTSYATNYYGYVLDGNEADARRQRRNYVHFTSRIKPEDDKPLGTFDRKDGAGRGIGYEKGAMVFHMLARRIGQENFWAAMRRLTEEYVGAYADWDDLRRLFEETSGASLDTFFQQWVRGAGAPMLRIESAVYDGAGQSLTLSLTQGDMAFELEVPVRVYHTGGHVDVLVPLDAPTETVTVPIEVVPEGVELDPDYHVFRKLSLQDLFPTTAATRSGTSLATVLPDGEIHNTFRTLQSIFESSFDQPGDERITRTAGGIEEGALAERCALILGEAVRDPYVAGFLSAVEFPVHFTDEGIEFDGVTYGEDGHAVLATVAHPGVPGGGVTVVYGNTEAAVPPANVIPMYDRSLVIFQNGMPIVRHDFERRCVVSVER